MTTVWERSTIAAEHLVGNLWFNLDALPLVAGKLEPDSMRSVIGGPAAMAYSEMCRLMRSDSERLSAGALEASLRAQKFDFDWLAKLQSRVLPESIDRLDSYAETINNAADLRNLQLHCADTLDQSKQEDARADVLTGKLLTSLSSVNRSANTVEAVSSINVRVRERLAAIREGRITWGASTGFRDLDKLMRLVNSELLLIAARPSQGKTSLAMQIAINRAQALLSSGEDGQIIIFSAEMSKDELMTRAACTVGRVNYDRITTRMATNDEWDAVEAAQNFLDLLPIYIDDASGPTVDQVYYRTAMLNAQKPVVLMVTDHTELFSSNTRAEGETIRISQIVRGFKGIAKTLNLPAINLHQLGRDVDDRPDKQPVLSDLKYAGEADADKILFIHRPEYYIKRGDTCRCDDADKEGVAILTLAKNRNGPVGRQRLVFVEKYAMFGLLER